MFTSSLGSEQLVRSSLIPFLRDRVRKGQEDVGSDDPSRPLRWQAWLMETRDCLAHALGVDHARTKAFDRKADRYFDAVAQGRSLDELQRYFEECVYAADAVLMTIE